jgi:hypothetical protein
MDEEAWTVPGESGLVHMAPHHYSLSFDKDISQIPYAKRFAVGEPGNKVRTVTMTHSSLSLFLQPFAHSMLEVLKLDDYLKDGLSRGY